MGHLHDEHETIAGLRAVVAEKGEGYVYRRPPGEGYVCLYWDRGRDCPSCLVGALAAQFGLGPVPEYVEGYSVWAVLRSDTPSHVEMWFRERFTEPALRLLAEAQEVQDGGESWGRALADAEHAYAMWTQMRAWPRTAEEIGE